MGMPDSHSHYFAHELTKRCSSDSIEKLAGAFVDAKVSGAFRPRSTTSDSQRDSFDPLGSRLNDNAGPHL